MKPIDREEQTDEDAVEPILVTNTTFINPVVLTKL